VSRTVEVLVRGKPKQSLAAPSTFDRNEMFREHMAHFLGRLSDARPAAVSLQDGARALRVALAARRSSELRRAVQPSEVTEHP
jgi:predicted dehydrogenase